MKTVVVAQSSYIPWKGYFHQIALCDEFIFFDDTQFTKRDWRSRNRIKSPRGLSWLTIPVESKGKFYQLIQEARISDSKWASNHWSTICAAYRRAPFFEQHETFFSRLYEDAARLELLSDVNVMFIKELAQLLRLPAIFTYSRQYPGDGRKTERLLDICRQAGATAYLSGPSAAAYIDASAFDVAKIRLSYMDYSNYPVYPQLWGGFAHDVSIIDPIFNVGVDATCRWLRDSAAGVRA